MHDKHQPLPSHEEVLICTPETTAEEVSVSEVLICIYHLDFHSVECPPVNSKYKYKRFSKSKRDDYNTILDKNVCKETWTFFKGKKVNFIAKGLTFSQLNYVLRGLFMQETVVHK